MTPRTIRRLVLAVFVTGIAGMIVGSIADNNGMAITFGLITAAAAVGLILVTAVAGPEAFARGSGVAGSTTSGDDATGGQPTPRADEEAAELERQIDELVATGADEATVRALVRQAITFGRHSA